MLCKEDQRIVQRIGSRLVACKEEDKCISHHLLWAHIPALFIVHLILCCLNQRGQQIVLRAALIFLQCPLTVEHTTHVTAKCSVCFVSAPPCGISSRQAKKPQWSKEDRH